jgi:hypothetical protein
LAAATATMFLNTERKPINIPKGWEAETTRLQRVKQDENLADFVIEDRLQRVVMQSHARFLVFPEAAVRRWTEATDAFWSRRSMTLKKRF